MAGKFEVATIFRGIDKMSAPIRRMTNRMDVLMRSADKRARSLAKTTGKITRGIGKIGAAATLATGLIVGGLSTASSAGITFEQTLANVSAKMGDTALRGSDAFAKMESAAQRTGAETEFSATQAADALNFMAMAGFNADQAVAALPGVVDLATASQTDLATATDIATDTLGAFGLQVKDSTQLAANLQRVNDVLAKTTTTSNTNMAQLFETMKKGGPLATAAGASIETAAAMAGIMAGAGIKADIAGTAMANAFLNLSKPSANAASVMRRLGVATTDSNGKLRDMPDIIDDLNRGFSRLTQSQRQAATEMIFGREGLAGTMAVLRAGGDELRRYRGQLEDAGGASAAMAKISRDTTQGSLNSLKSAVEGVSIALFQSNRGPMREAIDKATEWTRANGDAIALNLGGAFLALADNMGPLLTTFGTLVGLLLKAVGYYGELLGLANKAGEALGGFAFDVLNPPERPKRPVMLTASPEISSFTSTYAPGLQMIQAQQQGAVSSPQDRLSTQIVEKTQQSQSEIVIRDETGRAEVTQHTGPTRLNVVPTGGFN